MKRTPLWIVVLVVVGLLGAAAFGLSMMPTGLVAVSPSKPVDLEGLVTVDGRPAEPIVGHVALVGARETPVKMLKRLLLALDPKVDFTKEKDDAGRPVGVVTAQDRDSMTRSKSIAAAAAYEALGDKVRYSGGGAQVVAIKPNTRAARALKIGDIITKVDRTPVTTGVEAIRLIAAHAPGTVVKLGIRRSGRPVVAHITTSPPASNDPSHRSSLGIALKTPNLQITLPHDIEIDSGRVVGPSAGLAFAIYLYDSLAGDDNLIRGRWIVATGALTEDGQVVPVGRVRQKAIAAQVAKRFDLFLVPTANAAEAAKAIREFCKKGTSCVSVLPVTSVADAIRLLRLDDAALASHLATG